MNQNHDQNMNPDTDINLPDHMFHPLNYPIQLPHHNMQSGTRPELSINWRQENKSESFRTKLNELLNENEFTKEAILDLSRIYLDELPEKCKTYTWVTKLDVKTVQLKNLNNLPPNLIELIASTNDITEISENQLPASLKILHIKNNKISGEVKYLPENLEILDITGNKITKISNIPSKLKRLIAAENDIVEMPVCPDCTEHINLAKNEIIIINNLPAKLTELIIPYNNLIDFDENTFSKVEKLRLLIAHHNKITIVKYIPDTVTNLDISDSEVKIVDKLPTYLIQLDLSNNKITEINFNNDFPQNLHHIDIRKNKNLVFPDEIKEKIKLDKRFKTDFTEREDPRVAFRMGDRDRDNDIESIMQMHHHQFNMQRLHQMQQMQQQARQNNPNIIKMTKQKTI
jgi:Leucine-rich repeat (LRR) protein